VRTSHIRVSSTANPPDTRASHPVVTTRASDARSGAAGTASNRLSSRIVYRHTSAPVATAATTATSHSTGTTLPASTRIRSASLGTEAGNSTGRRHPTRGKPQRGTTGWDGGPR